MRNLLGPVLRGAIPSSWPILCISRQGLSSVCKDLRFGHCRSVDFGLPNDPCVDAGVVFLQPFAQNLRCVARTRAMGEQHNAVGLAQSLGDPVVERQVFRRALPMLAQFIGVVQVM
jgi:hypothetical protein